MLARHECLLSRICQPNLTLTIHIYSFISNHLKSIFIKCSLDFFNSTVTAFHRAHISVLSIDAGLGALGPTACYSTRVHTGTATYNWSTYVFIKIKIKKLKKLIKTSCDHRVEWCIPFLVLQNMHHHVHLQTDRQNSPEQTALNTSIHVVPSRNLMTRTVRWIAFGPREVISFLEGNLHAAVRRETTFFFPFLQRFCGVSENYWHLKQLSKVNEPLH